MTKEQAIAQADRFYSLYLKIAGKGPLTNKVVSAEIDPIHSRAKKSPQWMITSADGTQILVDDRTARPKLILLLRNIPPGAGAKRSDRDIEAQARKFLALFATAEQVADSPQVMPVSSQDAARSFRWRRIYKGILFNQQSVLIRVNSHSRELITAGYDSWGELPTNEIGNISQARAQELALQAVREKFKELVPRRVTVERRIVERNQFWEDSSSEPMPESRFAWLVILFGPPLRNQGVIAGVDSQSGKLVFGERMMGR